MNENPIPHWLFQIKYYSVPGLRRVNGRDHFKIILISSRRRYPYKDGYTKIVQNTQILTKIFGIFKH